MRNAPAGDFCAYKVLILRLLLGFCDQALEYLFKFIVQSRILYSRATCGMEEEQFRTGIQELFQSIRFVLSLDSRNSETLIFTQVREPPRILDILSVSQLKLNSNLCL